MPTATPSAAPLDGVAIVYCDRAFNTPSGKTAHGLVRFTQRYRVFAVLDAAHAGRDAGQVLDGKPAGIPIHRDLAAALAAAAAQGVRPTHFVIGLAPDGGRLPPAARAAVRDALHAGLNVDSGLHDFLSDDAELVALAREKSVRIRDVRKTPPRSELHFFSGKIEEVRSCVIALLGTDSAVGKRTTAWILVHGLRAAGFSAEMIGTGQTGWMQGAKYSLILDSLINDFVSGEIEHAVWSAWNDSRPDFIVLEGQGSLMNPAYPGGFELLAAGRPRCVILQHAPARKEYDGFPGYPIQPLARQIEAIQVISGRPVAAITINHEDLQPAEIAPACRRIESETGLPTVDPLIDGPARLVAAVRTYQANG